jgi:hypothetical protein
MINDKWTSEIPAQDRILVYAPVITPLQYNYLISARQFDFVTDSEIEKLQAKSLLEF